MALAGLVLRNLQQRPTSRSWPNELTKRFMATLPEGNKGHGADVKTTTEASKEVCVAQGRNNSRALSTDQNKAKDFLPPPLWGVFPSGLGNALMQATQNINRLFDAMNITRPQLAPAHVRKEEKYYKVRFEMPGLSRDDVKITVDDGILTVIGERKLEKEEEEEEEEDWCARIYCNTSITLPEDTKVDEIKAELKDGLLTITVPRIENPNKDVKEVQVH